MLSDQAPPRRSLARSLLASGFVDRLFAPHGIDRFLEQVDPRLVVRDIRAEIVQVDHQTRGTVTLTLAPTSAWTGFRAGQHVEVGVEIDGTVHTRCFSLAGAPTQGGRRIELTIKANASGRVSRHLVDRAAVGDVLRLSGPRGDFVLSEPGSHPAHLVFISGGSGITPVLSMLRDLVAQGHLGAVTFVHYADGPADVCYRQDLAELIGALPLGRLLFGYAREPDLGDLRGGFGAEHLAQIAPDPSVCQVYLCGPPSLMAAVEATCAAAGHADRVHLERFGPPAIPADLDTGTGVVAFERSALVVPGQGTLLATAEEAGLTPATGCRRGLCGTCTTPKTSGRVHDLVTGLTSATDAAPVRLCVSVPDGPVGLDL